MKDLLMILGPLAAVLVTACVLYTAHRADRCATELRKIRELLENRTP
ncbi:MAG: hypothetical protein P1V36_00520 [Planctomycetota bacterium]|nr:hypothetical protein [Planctomycetota bacterium]